MPHVPWPAPPTGHSPRTLGEIGLLCEGLGFTYWSLYRKNRETGVSRYLSNLPPVHDRWARMHREQIFAAVIELSLAPSVPLPWNMAQFTQQLAVPERLDLAPTFNGISQVLEGAGAHFEVFTVMRAAPALGQQELVAKGAYLQWLGRQVRAWVEVDQAAISPATGIVLPSLTPRQVQVMRLVVEGQTAQQIAERLGVSRRTVRFHEETVMRLLGAVNIAAAAYMVGHLSLL